MAIVKFIGMAAGAALFLPTMVAAQDLPSPEDWDMTVEAAISENFLECVVPADDIAHLLLTAYRLVEGQFPDVASMDPSGREGAAVLAFGRMVLDGRLVLDAATARLVDCARGDDDQMELRADEAIMAHFEITDAEQRAMMIDALTAFGCTATFEQAEEFTAFFVSHVAKSYGVEFPTDADADVERAPVFDHLTRDISRTLDRVYGQMVRNGDMVEEDGVARLVACDG